MKNIRAFVLLLCIALSGAMSSCYDDLSSLDIKPIPGVAIDTTGVSKLAVYQFEHLIVNPKLNIAGLSESNLSYKWRINVAPDDTVYQVIGEEKNLDYEIRFKPNVAGKHHQLYYTVTDNSNGLEYIMAWPVVVRNNIGEGLVIAETSDGINTDLSHIMHSSVTSDYSGESVKHGVYSAINGRMIEGLVKQMRFTKVFGVDVLYAITNNSTVRINTLDYTYGGMNGDLFFSGSGSVKPQALGGIVQGDIFIADGKLTGTYLGAARKIGLPFDFPFVVPDHVALNGYNTYPPVRINFYDEVNGHFVYMPTIQQFGDRKMHKAPTVTDGAFNPASLPGKVNMAAKVNGNGDFLHLLKDKVTGAFGLYVMDGGGSNYPSPIPPAPKAFYDLSSAPDIENAKQFVLLDNQRVMYYATSSKIYAVLYATDTPVFEERYTVPAGEEITTLQIYQQADYPFRSEGWDPPYINTNNRQLIMSTYGTEGKVYFLPMINTGVGNIDASKIKVFPGFKRIMAIAPQI